MILTNPWIGYIDRSYEQIKANILTKFQSLVPEITDHTETNPWVKCISIWAAIAEMLGYYLDSNARECYLTTALEFSSAVKIARSFDYRVKGAVPASVTLRFTSSIAATGPISIPIGTRVQTDAGIIFTTTSAGTINTGQTFVDVQAKQWEAVTNVDLGNSSGATDQEFALEEGVADGSVSVTVGVNLYVSQETFAFSFSNSEDFVAGLGEDTQMYIRFGDSINGKIPPSGQSIICSYYITEGSGGNIGANRINQLVSVISVPGSEVITVNNAGNATGGADFEDLAKLQKRIPLSVRTKYRAVTEQDFIDLTEMYAGVERAGVEFDCDVDKYVHVYVIPEGGGVAAPQLITDVYNYLNLRKIITTVIQVVSAGTINIKITANVTALPGFSNATVQSNVQQSLIDFFDASNQEIKGDVIIGDLYEAIEEATGVKNAIITLIIPVPFAQNLTTPTNVLNWTRALQAASATTQDWLIRFISNSTFELYKGTDFVNTFLVNNLVSQTEITFTINGNHQAGDDYKFYTYPYNQSVDLAEPSIPGTEVSDLTINVTGGI
jgi:uncharacterized phage protein gp47/JayE